MKLQKFRWSKVYESSEEELVAFLKARRIAGEHWTAEAMHAFGPKQFDQAMTLWCAEGSFIIEIDGDRTSMQPGDATHLPAKTEYSLTAGMSGCICYETIR